MIESPLRLRFAPSPTGSLHLGNARTALFNWLAARQCGGTLVLRIEDTDTARRQEGSEAGILDDLRWLGIDWDEGPFRQSERSALQAEAAVDLLRRRRAYRCFCSEEEIEIARAAMRGEGHVPRYPGTCASLDPAESDRRAEAGEPHAVRFRVTGATVRYRDRFRGVIEAGLADLGDPVLVRTDGRPTYNFAVVVDDAAMKIDLVLRGDDHLSNTPVQALLFEALGAKLPEFAHLPMVRGEDGGRLSKRHGAVSVADYRRRGYPVDGLVNALALLGWGPADDQDVLDREDLLRDFDLDRVSLSPSTFDAARLEHLCGQHVQRMPAADLAVRVSDRLIEAGSIPADVGSRAPEWLEGVADMLRTKIDRFDQVTDRASGLFFAGGVPGDEAARDVILAGEARLVLEALARRAAADPPESSEDWKVFIREVGRESGARGKGLFQPVRVAVTGSRSGPELDRLVPLVVTGSRSLPDHVPDLAGRVRRVLEALG